MSPEGAVFEVPPTLIAINHDDYHAKHVGRTAGGWQFFLTTPFVPAKAEVAGAEFVALYLFHAAGQLMEAVIDNFGPTCHPGQRCAPSSLRTATTGTGQVTFERIEVAPFALDRFGTTFGLVVRQPDSEDEGYAVELHPGIYMAFFEPWDSGDYDT
jgi:hypothetical protein